MIFRLQLQLYVAGLGANPSTKIRLDLNKRRLRLQNAVDKFNNEASLYVPDYLREWISEGPDVTAEDGQYMSLLEEDPDQPTLFVLPKLAAENNYLCFPSTIGGDALKAAGYGGLVEKELLLRQGQANDSLQGVRTSLGEKSFLFRHDLRLADSKVKKTKSWTRLVTVNKKVNQHRWAYEKCRAAMIRLGADDNLLGIYRTLTREDCKVSTAVMMPNQSGQRDITLAWFWTLPSSDTRVGYMDEPSSGELLKEGKDKQPSTGSYCNSPFSVPDSLATCKIKGRPMERGAEAYWVRNGVDIQVLLAQSRDMVVASSRAEFGDRRT